LNSVAQLSFDDSTVPGAGQGVWYLVRIVYSAAGANGSYDDEGTGTSRDQGIAASQNACP
jgi:hypothetical protein